MQRWLEPITGVSGDVVASLKRNDRRTMREWRQQERMAMTSQDDDIAALLRPMLSKRLWVALATLSAKQSQVQPHIAEHLRWMAEREAEGVLWASGPFPVEGVVVGDGMTILNVETEAQARELMDDEPLTRRGLRPYELRRWELREARMVIELDTATSSYRLVRETTRC
jgi:uncharacterized protein YciI